MNNENNAERARLQDLALEHLADNKVVTILDNDDVVGTRPMKMVARTVWINKYPQYDDGKIYPTEWDASINAIHGCQGQHPVTYSVEIPA